MTITPMGDRVVVRIKAGDTESEGGIVIPEAHQEHSRTGEVLAVGPGLWTPEGGRAPMDVKVGDTVLLGRYAVLDISGEKNIVMTHESDIQAVLS